jgi:hypothetical protein
MIKHPPSDGYSIIPSSLQPPRGTFSAMWVCELRLGREGAPYREELTALGIGQKNCDPGWKMCCDDIPCWWNLAEKNIHVISWIGKIPFPEFSEALIIRNLHGLEKVVVLVLFFLVSESRGAGSTLWPQWTVSFSPNTSYLHISSILGCLQSLARCKGKSTGKPIYQPNIGVSSVNFPQPKPDLGFFPNLEPNLAKPRPFTVDSGPKSERWKRRDPSPSRLCRLCRHHPLPWCRGPSQSFPARCCQRKAGSGELETSAIRHGWALETHCRMMWEWCHR